MKGTASPKSGPRQRPSDEDNDEVQNAAEITREYETLKAKFDLWQALQAENRNSSEARQLHMEIIYQHDSLMKKLQQTTDIGMPSGKSRPGIASDTFTPWNANGSGSPKLPSQNSRISRKPEARRPAALPTSRWTPSYSAHSLSPATSTSSEETTRSQFDNRKSRAVATERSAATVPTRLIFNKQHSSANDERERALLRIVEEANELKRKEQELRGSPGYAAAKGPSFASTSRNTEESGRRGVPMTSPNTLPKHSPNRGSSDGNNNSISTASQRRVESNYANPKTLTTFPKVTPVQPIRPSYQFSLKPSQSKEYVHAAFTGIHPSVSSPEIRSEEKNQRNIQKSPPLAHGTVKSSPLLEKKKDSPIAPRINNFITTAHEKQVSSAFLKETKTPAKLRHLRGKEVWAASLEQDAENSNKPQAAPESNIRKVKEAVKQQTLGQKSAGAALLHLNQMKASAAQDTGKSSNAYTEKSSDTHTEKSSDSHTGKSTDAYFPQSVEATLPKEIPRVTSVDRISSSENGEVTNNISQMIKDGLPSLRKVGLPVEKSGIALGKVVDGNSWDNYMYLKKIRQLFSSPFTDFYGGSGESEDEAEAAGSNWKKCSTNGCARQPYG
ncbi:hypothetical protein ANCCAN_10157 [Ancylostoma caninum]|uniref:Uncharacterized protein n=1 Tax=Ancylostoma caninum TaxID=29170 RepID=A0A368GKP9_ANCCA|nr:hypothetical protein ANCCAN_10157 [Ancylostoma caninum]